MFRDIGTVSVTVVSVGKHSNSYAGYVALQESFPGHFV